MEKSNILMYTTEGGVTKAEVMPDNDTAWLSSDQIADLFQRNRSTISRHIRNIFLEGELSRDSVVASFATISPDGKRYHVDSYNLDVIISVGYRVRSLRGTQFRIQVTNILKEYMIKGFALDDERLRNLSEGNYFNELLMHIRDIRSSEKALWREMLEIYTTSIDYNLKAESPVQLFRQVQNEMRWVACKYIATETIYQRADADKGNMGLITWNGKRIELSDVEVVKNYLDEKELDTLNKIVATYSDIAEVHALNQEPVYMKDWLETTDDYLRMTRRDILATEGKVTHQQALEKAHLEYEKYKRNPEYALSLVECYFLENVGELDKLDRDFKQCANEKQLVLQGVNLG